MPRRQLRKTLRHLSLQPGFHALIALLTFLVLIAGGELLVQMDSARAQEEQHSIVTARTADLRARLETELASTIFLARGLVAYASGFGDTLDEEQARRLIRAIYDNGRNVRNIAVAPDSTIRWIYPLKGNEKLLGLPYSSLPKQWPCVQRAMRSRDTVLAGPIDLIQGGQGVIVRTPVFRADGRYWGLISITIDWDSLQRRIELLPPPPDLKLAIRGRDAQGESGEVFYGTPSVFAENPVTARIALPGGSWIIAAAPREGWAGETPHQMLKRGIYLILATAFTLMLLGYMRDAAERRRINSELRQLNASLEERVETRTTEIARANEELNKNLAMLQQTQDNLIQSEKLASLGSLVAGLAHELNTPIGNSLLAASSQSQQIKALRAPEQALSRSAWLKALDEIDEAAQIIERSLGRASELIVSFKQVAADGTSSQRRRFSLEKTISDFLLVLQPTIKHSGLQILTAIPPDIALDSYPGILEQVLMNLIQNAIIHAFPEQKTGKIRIGAHALDNGQVVIWVADDGSGIPPENLPRVFDPFFTTRMGQGGTGLGLNIVYNLVTGPLGGHIEVHSEPGQGACFEFSLPLSAPQKAQG
jgi:sensor domain CHASE-containing protein